MNKTDMDAAYRRIHTNMLAAVTCITVVNDIAYLLTRVPFGAAPAPAGFSLSASFNFATPFFFDQIYSI
jgi:hypothetical protein